MYRRSTVGLEYFLVHPGGPFWARKDLGAWSIPKGMVEANEDVLEAAQREFKEETGLLPKGPYISLGSLKTRGGKILHAWAFTGDWDPETGIRSNYIQIEYPYGSKKYISIPEVDRGAWWSFEQALAQINPSQSPIIVSADALLRAL
jgi:predicted NUDIX family NTP pyrophosphohydrolase